MSLSVLVFVSQRLRIESSKTGELQIHKGGKTEKRLRRLEAIGIIQFSQLQQSRSRKEAKNSAWGRFRTDVGKYSSPSW